MISFDIYQQRAYQLIQGAVTTTTLQTSHLSAVTRNRVLRNIDPSYKKGTGKMPANGHARMLANALRAEYKLCTNETWGNEAEFNVSYEHLPPEAYARLNELFIAEKVSIRMAGEGNGRDYRLWYINRGYGIWGGDTLPASGRFEFRHLRPDQEVKEMMLAASKRPENAARIALAVQHILDGRPLHVIFTKE